MHLHLVAAVVAPTLPPLPGTGLAAYLTQPAVLLALLAGYLLPLLTAIIARQHWPSALLGPITAVLSAVTGFVSEWAQHPSAYSWRDGGLRAVFVAGFALVGLLQSWRKTGLHDKLLAWPRRIPPGGVQPGQEPSMDAAA